MPSGELVLFLLASIYAFYYLMKEIQMQNTNRDPDEF